MASKLRAHIINGGRGAQAYIGRAAIRVTGGAESLPTGDAKMLRTNLLTTILRPRYKRGASRFVPASLG